MYTWFTYSWPFTCSQVIGSGKDNPFSQFAWSGQVLRVFGFGFYYVVLSPILLRRRHGWKDVQETKEQLRAIPIFSTACMAILIPCISMIKFLRRKKKTPTFLLAPLLSLFFKRKYNGAQQPYCPPYLLLFPSVRRGCNWRASQLQPLRLLHSIPGSQPSTLCIWYMWRDRRP